jgi:hypothetical protein
MNTASALRYVAGVALIHLAMTACSEKGTGVTTAAADVAATNGSVEVATEDCTKSFEVQPPAGAPGNPAPQVIRYAEHAYPGRTKHDLAGRVTNWNEIAGSPSSGLRAPGYDLDQQLVVYVRDGMVGAPCLGTMTKTTFIYTP